MSTSDKFSFTRFRMVAAYWWPRLRTQFFIFLLVSAALGLLGGMLDRFADSIFGNSLASFPDYLAFVGAAIFAGKKGREFNTALPAANSEKISFRLIYSLLVIPCITIVLSILMYSLVIGPDNCEMHMGLYLKEKGLDANFLTRLRPLIIFSNVMIPLALSMVTLYCATFIQRNAAIKSIAISLGSYICISFALGIAVGIYAVILGFEHGYAGAEPDITEITDMVQNNIMPGYMWFMSVLCTIILALFLTLYIKRFPRVQSK